MMEQPCKGDMFARTIHSYFAPSGLLDIACASP
ncbi:MAG: hypothetical protein RLZZ396_314 [Planctomycetota bacterium]